MNGTEMKYPNRLKELMERENLTIEQFAKQYYIALKTVNNYRNGNSSIPQDIACKIADDYNVSIDWLYGRSNFSDRNDIMADILMSLQKVFKFTSSKNPDVKSGNEYDYSAKILFVDKRFCDWIRDVAELKRFKENGIVTSEDYETKYTEVYLKHRDMFRQVFNSDNFNIKNSIAIESLADISIIDLISQI